MRFQHLVTCFIAASASAFHILVLKRRSQVAPLHSSETDADIGDDNWRIQRARLEEAHSRQIRRRKRLFLPYVDSCLWARRQGFKSKEEWDDWINMGEKRNPYITRNPEKYYSEQGTWRGWGHYLGYEDIQITITTDGHDECGERDVPPTEISEE